MSRRRFYATPDDIAGAVVNLSADETHHLVHVLRIIPGSEVFVFDGCGREYRCKFEGLKGDRARLEIVGLLGDRVESPVRVTLAQALAKGEKFELIVQKATELGVSAIVPLVTDYTDVKLIKEQTVKRLERWRRISLEALKQSGRRALIEIKAPLTLKEFLDTDQPLRETLVVFSEKGGASIKDALAEVVDPAAVTALVGPEGGWSERELGLLAERGARAVTLGPRVLRTETAALVAITLIGHALGDLSS